MQKCFCLLLLLLLRKQTHLDFMLFVVEMFKQDLHTAVVPVSHEDLVLLLSTQLSWTSQGYKQYYSKLQFQLTNNHSCQCIFKGTSNKGSLRRLRTFQLLFKQAFFIKTHSLQKSSQSTFRFKQSSVRLPIGSRVMFV